MNSISIRFISFAAPCQQGHYSRDGLTPCMPCPLHHFQYLKGQTSCQECKYNERTYETGRISSSECVLTGMNTCILLISNWTVLCSSTTPTTNVSTTTTTTTNTTTTTSTTTTTTTTDAAALAQSIWVLAFGRMGVQIPTATELQTCSRKNKYWQLNC